LAVTWMRGSDYLLKQADPEKLKADTPHVIESPECCIKCERWGMELDSEGICESCNENEEVKE